jgi:enamine deaminase RidA (YjgF/YER057c/UK114 family)
MARRFVPFGSYWRMGIDVPYSLAVLDHGRLWSCGQCPLDGDARVLFPGDLRSQLQLVAGVIRAQFAPHGITPDRIGKLVAYATADAEMPLEAVETVLRQALEPLPLVVTIGVPAFYYPGMKVEIDVHGAAHGPATGERRELNDGARAAVVACGGAVHLQLELDRCADSSRLTAMLDGLLADAGGALDTIVSAHLFIARNLATAAQAEAIANAVGADPGAAVLAATPHGRAAVVDIIAESGVTGSRHAAIREGVCVVERRVGKALGIAARCAGPQRSLEAATRRIMEAVSHALAAHGFSFADVVKQQTYFIGAASQQDLYRNMMIRNEYYERPGPASTGLAVHGFGDPDCRITVEVLASARS